jgi:hypothetical protein
MERRQKLTRVELAVGMMGLGMLTLLAVVACDTGGRVSERGNITRSISNCRQVVMALKLYASDHNGKYPDAHVQDKKTANTVFRKLFDEEIIDSEAIFGCPISPFEPDGVIEDSYLGPESTRFAKALQPGENHWTMTAGVTDAMPGNIPLVYENPVSATWPPKWNPDAKGTPVRGRAWSTGIIIGLNDGSANIMPLASKTGKAVGLKPITGSQDLFDAAIDPMLFPKGEVLDVE